MTFQANPYALPLFAGVLPLSWIIWAAWKRRSSQEICYFFWFCLFGLGLILAYALELLSADLPSMIVWLRFEYVFHSALVFWLVFVLRYTGSMIRTSPTFIGMLFIVPVIVWVLVWTNDFHHLIWTYTGVQQVNGLAHFERTYGMGLWLWMVYVSTLTLTANGLLFLTMLRVPPLYRGQIVLLLVAGWIPWIGSLMEVLHMQPFDVIDPVPYGIALSSIPVAYSLFRFKLLDIMPVAYDNVVQSLADGVIIFNTKRVVIDANPAAQQMVGVEQGSLIGAPIEHIGMFAAQKNLFNPSMPATIEINAPNNVTQGIDLYVSPLLDWRGQLRGHAVLMHDVSDRKLAEQRALQLAVEQQRVGILSNFIRDASHEFRTPLSIIKTSAYLLTKVTDDTRRTELLQRVDQQTDDILRLVEDLEETARLDSLSRLELRLVDINQIVNVAVESARAVAETQRVSFDFAHPDGKLMLMGSDHELVRACRCLLSNALNNTPEGGAVTVSTACRDRQVLVTVCDTGVGIAPEHLPHIFERFYRIGEAQSKRGFGLGLSITQRIVELHHGSIEVDSTPGRGSTFTLHFPATAA